jgi:hypothetical protein
LLLVTDGCGKDPTRRVAADEGAEGRRGDGESGDGVLMTDEGADGSGGTRIEDIELARKREGDSVGTGEDVSLWVDRIRHWGSQENGQESREGREEKKTHDLLLLNLIALKLPFLDDLLTRNIPKLRFAVR